MKPLKSIRILMSAGEASGDMYGAQLLRTLRKCISGNELQFFGLCGTAMKSVGCEDIVKAEDVAVVGLLEVVRHLPRIKRRFDALLKEVDRDHPAIAVLIDFPDFNLRLAKELHARNIPVVYFISPQLWAWRKGRIQQIKKYVDKMIVIFPFEEIYYKQHGVDVEYVGHPLADEFPIVLVPAARPYIALLPGSRKQELERHLPIMLTSALNIPGNFDFQVPVASTLETNWVWRMVEGALKTIGGDPKRFTLTSDARVTLAGARASIVASGTATVEAALAGNPFVVVYRVSPVSYAVGRHLVDLPHYAMVNLIAGERVVPELIQTNCTPKLIVKHIVPLLEESPERAAMMQRLAGIRQLLHTRNTGGHTAIERAAALIQPMLNRTV